MSQIVKFQATPNVWIEYENAPIGLKEIMMHKPPPRLEIDIAIKKGKHLYQTRKFPNFLLLIAYDDVTGFPVRCIIDPEDD